MVKRITLLCIATLLFCKESKIDIPVPTFRMGLTTIFVPDRIETPQNPAAEIPVDVYRPQGEVQGNVLVLPGWNFPRQDWMNKTNLKEYADSYHFILIMPEMKKAIYATQYFPETTRKVFPIPSGKWITDVFLPEMQSTYKAFLPEQKNFLLGLSTGARGVAIISLHTKTLFMAGAGFSGDYDQTKMPKDRLMTAVYGSYAKFPKRWQTVDNPAHEASKFQTALYLSHGEKDKVVPAEQTKIFCDALNKKNPKLKVRCFFDEKAGHNYKFWQSQLKPAFQFFSELSGIEPRRASQ